MTRSNIKIWPHMTETDCEGKKHYCIYLSLQTRKCLRNATKVSDRAYKRERGRKVVVKTR